MIYKAIYSICFSLTFLAPAAAQALTLCGKSAQGEVLTACAPGAVKVELNGKSYPVTPDGKFIFAFGRDEASSAKLTVSTATAERRTILSPLPPPGGTFKT